MWNKLIFPLAGAALLCSSLAAQSDQPAAPELPDGNGKAIVQAVCTRCHDLDRVVAAGLIGDADSHDRTDQGMRA